MVLSLGASSLYVIILRIAILRGFFLCATLVHFCATENKPGHTLGRCWAIGQPRRRCGIFRHFSPNPVAQMSSALKADYRIFAFFDTLFVYQAASPK